MKSHDSRRWQNHPHLTVSLAYVRDILRYLARAWIQMYRLSCDLAPYATHAGLPQYHTQLEESRTELAAVGAMARAIGVRLSVHLGQHAVLNAEDRQVRDSSVSEVMLQVCILDAMELGPEAVVVAHLGGVYGDRDAARARFVETYTRLPDAGRRRIVLENDDVRFGVSDLLWVHERCGVPLVFDILHHQINNPRHLPARDALAACLATWGPELRPKTHFSSPRTSWLAADGDASHAPRLRRPRWAHHSDYVDPFGFISFLDQASGLREFDVMLEAKAKDLALIQLRRDVARFAPALAQTLDPTTQPAVCEGVLAYAG
jgi:UV DNA damage endonuclease